MTIQIIFEGRSPENVAYVAATTYFYNSGILDLTHAHQHSRAVIDVKSIYVIR